MGHNSVGAGGRNLLPVLCLSMSQATEHSQNPPPSLRARLLGGLIVWQLLFIPLANVLDFFPHREVGRDEITDFRELPREMLVPRPIVEPLSAVTDRWAQLTGQYQMWWLFAPEFPPQATFPTVELRWPDRPSVQLRSIFEPADPNAYCRLPGRNDRLFQYEVHLGLGLVYWNEAEARPQVDAWRDLYRSVVARQWKSMRAYLRWRLREYQAGHPDDPLPSEMILSMRIYPTRLPGQSLQPAAGAIEQPLARWHPSAAVAANTLPLEAYDPFSREFVKLGVPLNGPEQSKMLLAGPREEDRP